MHAPTKNTFFNKIIHIKFNVGICRNELKPGLPRRVRSEADVNNSKFILRAERLSFKWTYFSLHEGLHDLWVVFTDGTSRWQRLGVSSHTNTCQLKMARNDNGVDKI